MADFLEQNFGAESTPVSLDSFVQTETLSPLPSASVNNRAATVALMSDKPEQAVDRYQVMVQEASHGADTTAKELTGVIQQNIAGNDLKGLMQVLADPKIPLDQKQGAISGLKNNPFLTDLGNELTSRSIIAPSAGENAEQADIRIDSADLIRDMYNARNDIQGLVNAHGASLPDAGIGTLAGMAETWILPFGNNVSTGRVANDLEQKKGLWPWVKNIALAGTSTSNIREKLESLPPEARVEYAKSVLQSISSRSGVVFPGSNSFAQFDKANQIFGEGGYSSFDEFLDNVAPLLDAVGIGQAVRGLKAVPKAASVIDNIPHIVGKPGAVDRAAPIVRSSLSPSNQTAEEAATYNRWMSSVDDIVDGQKFTDPATGEVYVARVVEAGKDKRGNQRGKSVSLMDSENSPVFNLASNGEAGKDVGFFGASMDGANGAKWETTPIYRGAQPKQFTPASAVTQPSDLAQTTGRPTAGAFDDRINALQEKKAAIMGEAGNTLDRGQVASIRAERASVPRPPDRNTLAKEIQERDGITSKAAKAEADKQIADLQADYSAKVARYDQMLEANAKASTASQRIDSIDKEIATLEKNNTPKYLRETPLWDAIRSIEMNSVVKRENPASPGFIMGMSNPAQARSIHSTIAASNGDQVANGLMGVSKEQALVNNIYPGVTTERGTVTAKTFDIEQNVRTSMHVPGELKEVLNSSGAINYTDKERAAQRANLVNDFTHATGLSINDAMSSFTNLGGSYKVQAVYGAADGGFRKAEQAVEQALVGLRQYGIREDELTILRRSGNDYTPVSLNDVRGVDGDYLVRVNTNYEPAVYDVGDSWSKFDVKRNFMDRIGALVSDTKGSASRWIMDASSMLHKDLTGPAIRASDATASFENKMLEMAAEFSNGYMKMKKERRVAMDDYIREANFNEIKFDPVDLKARGFSNAETDVLQSWRNYWDAHHYFENNDLIRTLNSQGFQYFKNANAELYARPIAKNQNVGRVYDPGSDQVVVLSKSDLDTLYNNGGTLAKLRRPADFNGTVTEYMISRNTPQEYLRKFRDSDTVLNYRDGYFQLQYKAPQFVRELVSDPSGSTSYLKAIAVAGTRKEAEMFAQRTATATGKPIENFKVTGDVKASPIDNDAWWDVQSSAGRIAQKHRGALLEDAAGMNHIGDTNYIVNPVESAVRAARSISGRTVTRPMLEAAKARFMKQYSDFLPPDGMGGHKWPSSIGEISQRGNDFSTDLADVRTTFEYINYLENGYINGMDTVFKAFLNSVAELAADVKAPAFAERGLRAGAEANISGTAKGAVFGAYIASNFLRQLIVQPHQAVRMMSYNPQAFFTGQFTKLMAEYPAVKLMAGNTSDFTKFVDSGGMLQAVDRSNLVRGTLLEAAGQTAGSRTWRVAKAPLNTARKIGFDVGEQVNLLGHHAAVFDRYKRQGRDLTDPVIREEALSEVRALSYDMNFAGDMVYNQTSPSVLLQFLQIPHKALLQMTNRRLDGPTRARLVAGDIVLWGSPAAAIGSLMGTDILPEDPAWRQIVTDGVEGLALNNLFSMLFDEAEGPRTNIDFSSFNPYEMDGWKKFAAALWSGGIGTAIANSPAGQIFAKDGGRMDTAFSSLARYFGVVDDIDQEPQEALSVLKDVASILSGPNNFMKAKIALEYRKKFDQYGSIMDDHVTTTEAIAQALGFDTADVRKYYEFSMSVNKDTKAYRDEVDRAYNDIKRYYYRELEKPNTDPEYITKVSGAILQAFRDDPQALQQIQRNLERDLKGPDTKLLELALRRAQIPNRADFDAQLKMSPIPEEQQQKIRKYVDDLDAARKEIKKD